MPGREHGAQSTGHRAQWRKINIFVLLLKNKSMEDFRFEQLDIWKEANKVSDILFDYAEGK